MKKLVGLLGIICMILLPIRVEAENLSGSCGANLTWTLSGNTLTIQGTGDMTDYSFSEPSPWYSYADNIENLVLSDGITSIGNNAFYYCEMTSVSIPNGVTDIGDHAFRGCFFLENITLPNTLVSIGEMAFSYNNCTSITLPASLTSIGTEAFYSSDELTSIWIPANVKEIGEMPFVYCDELLEIKVDGNNQNYASDDNGVLYTKDKTKLLVYPEGKTNATYQIPGHVTYIGDRAFYSNNNLQQVVLPDTVTGLGKNAFAHCNQLEGISIPASIRSISDYAFGGCEKLSYIDIKGSEVSIGEQAFYGCDGLVTLVVPSGVAKIGYGAFTYCDNLTSITIPVGVTEIESMAFACNPKLKEIKVDVANQYYCVDAKGTLYNKDKTVLLQYPIGATSTYYEVPEGVKTIEYSAFLNCTNLNCLVVPSSVETISLGAFTYADEDFGLYGYKDTYVEAYANRYEIPFYDITIVHERFRDIPEDSWYTKSVQFVFDNGYMIGKVFNKFDAEGKLTRAEFVTTLYKIAGAPDVSGVENVFTDVKDSWYTTPVLWANSTGCVSGYGDGRFGVDDNITREQLVLILYKNSGDRIPEIDENVLDTYKDVSSISSYALTAMKWAVSNGIMSGTSEGKLNPQGNATRAECAVMLNKYCSLLQ